MKKKIFIASAIVLVIFLVIFMISMRRAKYQSPIQEQTKQMTQDAVRTNDVISAVYDKFPWYGKIPIVTDEYTIAFNFEKNSFRIIFLKPSTAAMKNAALESIKNIGADLDQFDYYFIEPEQSEFENLLN